MWGPWPGALGAVALPWKTGCLHRPHRKLQDPGWVPEEGWIKGCVCVCFLFFGGVWRFASRIEGLGFRVYCLGMLWA